MVPGRYKRGFVIAKMDSRKEFGDSEQDYIVKRLFVRAEENEIEEWELVGEIGVETISAHEMPIEVYRMPFPTDLRVRLAVLKEMREHPKFFVG